MSEVVICLWTDNGFDRAAQGVAGAGRRLADELGGGLHALTVGEGDTLARALSGIADHIVIADDPRLSEARAEPRLAALTELCAGMSPRVVLFGDDTLSQEIVPRLAHRLGGSSLADGGEIAPGDGVLRVTRSAYGGRATAVYELRRAPAVVWLRARSFAPPGEQPKRARFVESADLDLPEDAGPRVVERRVEAQDRVPLEEAQRIVSGGRGLGGPEPFADLERLAGVMGAEVGASRVACDEGWVPPTWQIGQTGKKVAPDLYLAVGISGAAQHLLGIADAKVIAAINNDPNAPIFKWSSFGIVEDFRKVLPLLTEKLAELRG